jgi:hypothetical protein
LRSRIREAVSRAALPTKFLRHPAKPFWSCGEDRGKQKRRTLGFTDQQWSRSWRRSSVWLTGIIAGLVWLRCAGSASWASDFSRKGRTMLAEKFFLYLEALIKSQQTHSDGAPRVISNSPHVPVKLPGAK